MLSLSCFQHSYMYKSKAPFFMFQLQFYFYYKVVSFLSISVAIFVLRLQPSPLPALYHRHCAHTVWPVLEMKSISLSAFLLLLIYCCTFNSSGKRPCPQQALQKQAQFASTSFVQKMYMRLFQPCSFVIRLTSVCSASKRMFLGTQNEEE